MMEFAGKLIHTLNGHCGTIIGASFSPSGEKVFTIGMDRVSTRMD